MASNNFGRLCRDQVMGSLQIKSKLVIDPSANLDVNNAVVRGNLKVKGCINGRFPYPDGHVCGFGINVLLSEGNTTDMLQITEGNCRDSINTRNLDLIAPLEVSLSISGAGGLDTGSPQSNEWYAVHVIGDTNKNNEITVILSLSHNNPTLPSGYDLFRRIGWARSYDAGEADVHFVPLIQKCKGKCRWYCYDWWHLNQIAIFIPAPVWIDIGWLPIDLSPFVPPTSCSADIKAQFNNFFVSELTYPNPITRLMLRIPGSATTIEPIGNQPADDEVTLGAPVIIWGQAPGGVISESVTICTGADQSIEGALMTPSGFAGFDEERPVQIVVTGFHDDLSTSPIIF